MSAMCPTIRTSPASDHSRMSAQVTDAKLSGSVAPARTKAVPALLSLTIRAAFTYSDTPLSYKRREAIVTTMASWSIPRLSLNSSCRVPETSSSLNSCRFTPTPPGTTIALCLNMLVSLKSLSRSCEFSSTNLSLSRAVNL